MLCPNCSSCSPAKQLNSVNSEKDWVITSDAKILEGVKAARELCPRCGCVYINYVPENRLQEYFANEYDISESTQNNLIVSNETVIHKRTLLWEDLFAELEKHIRKTGLFLEIACGKGDFCCFFSHKYPAWQCWGIDPSFAAPEGTKNDNIIFVRDFFDERLFLKKRFDFVAAHGFLNRSAVLPALIKIGNLCNKGALLSLELLLMENSLFSPYIWDHPFMYSQSVFELYLKHTGFIPVKITNCGSSVHYLCKKKEKTKKIETIGIPDLCIAETEQIFQEHLDWWKTVNNNLMAALHCAPKHRALFGAGLFNAALFSFVSPRRFTCVVDEIKAGKQFFDLPVISLAKAQQERPTVFLCSRPEYFFTMKKKLERNGIAFIKLNP